MPLILLRLFDLSGGDEARPKVVWQEEIKARAALDTRGLLGYHYIRVRRESVMEECCKT
jgi:hypothetical protein